GEKGILGSQMGDGAIPAHVYRESLVVGRPRLIAAYESYFADNTLSALVIPTTPLPARPIGQDETVELNGEQVPTFFTYIRNTDVASNAGVPCLSVPAGLTADGLPVGIEFVGATGDDATVLGIGKSYEAARGPVPGPNL
ncbi:MAG: amidase family protein, partial [Alphaproteobacteria bacterium]|nr:amidase family protein [Alphaproteobacteria bacterium]